VDTFIAGGGATNRPLSANPTLTFDADGTVHVFSGCNSGSGNFELEGTTLTLSEMTSTVKGCTDEAQQLAERDVQAVMSAGEVTIEIDAARLTLMRGELGLSATTE
jgi:heat shock protein HslJ